METSGKSRKKGRNKRITNNIGRGSAFINRPPVLNREFEPAPEELHETLSSEDLDFDPEEQHGAKARPHKVKYTSCKVIQTGNNIEFIWHKGPVIPKEVEPEQPQPLKVNHWLRPTGTNLPNETISCQEPSEVEHSIQQSDMRPEPSKVASSPTEQVAGNPEETQVVVTLKEPQVSVIPKEPHVAFVPEEPQVAVTPIEPQVTLIPTVALEKAEPKQSKPIKPVPNSVATNHAIEAELRMYLQELSKADPSRKLIFVDGQLGLPDALVRSVKERQLDQKTEPSQVPEQTQPLPANPCPKSTDTNLQDDNICSQEIDEVEFPLVRGGTKKGALASENQWLTYKIQPRGKVLGHIQWRKGPHLAVIPEEVEPEEETPKEPQVTVIPKQPHVAVVPEPELQMEKMTAIPEVAFMQDQNAELITLESEQEALLKEVEQLREMLQRALQIEADTQHETRIKTLQLQMSEAETSEKGVLCKISTLEEAIKNEASHQKEAEMTMACQREQHSELMAALVKTDEGIKQEMILWEEEKANLLTSIKEQQQILEEERTRNLTDSINQSKESSRLVAALVETEEGIKQETLQWEMEKTNLLPSLNEQQQAPDQEINTTQRWDTLDDLNEEDTRLLAALVKTEEDKKEWEKKKSTLLQCMNEQQQQAHNNKIPQNQLRDIIVNQSEKNTKLVGALVMAEESLTQETLEWEEENATGLQTMQQQQQDLETSREQMKERLDQVSQPVGAFVRKPSLLRRFLRLFRCTGGISPPPLPPPNPAKPLQSLA